MPSKHLILSILIFVATAATANNTDPFGFKHLADSLEQRLPQTQGEEKYQTIYRLYRVYSMTRETSELFDLINQAIEVADSLGIPKLRMEARVMLMSYYNNMSQPDTLLAKMPPQIELAEELGEWDTYFILYDKIATWTRISKGNEEAAKVTDHIYRKAKELNNPIGLGSALKLTGQSYIFQRREDEAKQPLIEAIKEFDKVEVVGLKFEPYLFYVLRPGNKNEENRLQMLKLFEKDLALVDKKLADRKTIPEYGMRFHLNRMYFEYYLEDGNYAKARQYYHLLTTQPSFQSPINQEAIFQMGIKLYSCTKEFDKAFELIESLENNNGNINYFDKLIAYLDLYRAMGDSEKMYWVFNEIVAYTDSVQQVEVSAQIDELHTRYEVDRHILEKKHQRVYTLVAIAGCMLLLIIILIIVRYNRRLQAKNRRLYEQIQKNLRQSKQAEQHLADAPAETLTREAELYRRLNELMQAEHLFTDPNIDRRTLADRLGTNERYLADAIHQQANETVGGYLGRLRLQYALQLLNSRPELTLDAVAIDSGHTSYSTFYRAFGKMYGMSPSEYRRISTKKEI